MPDRDGTRARQRLARRPDRDPAIEPLRWSLLRERIGDDDVTDLHLASVPGAVTTTELAAWMTPAGGPTRRPDLVTEALALLRQPRAVVDASPMH
jgi:hypothetical protein